MDAIASVVLPSVLGADAQRVALERFLEWADAFEPVAELNHGYGTSEIRYGPADPRPGWAAQLAALDLEARHRFDTSFPELELEERTALVRDHLERVVDGPGMASPERAPHVAAALMAHWFRSSEATDLCYEVSIERLSCRGIETAPQRPAALERG